MNWTTIIKEEMQQPYFQLLAEFLEKAYATKTVFPPKDEIFNAFAYTPYDKVKVVLLGQDPYHGKRQAHGLSFSVLEGQALPPSLHNIYKELELDLNIPMSNNGYLKPWADQGVLLLNTVLTVEEGTAHSHRNQGWETFTDHILQSLNAHETPIVFLLLGSAAMKKASLIDQSKHFIVHAPHPSPLSAYRGFFGSHVFSKTNELLADCGLVPIQWEIPDINAKKEGK